MLGHRRNLLLLWVTGLLLGLRGYPQESVQNTDPNKTYQLAGKVVSSVTRKPIPRVLVRLPQASQAVLTGADGDFLFNDVPTGKTDILVTKPGYFRADQPLSQLLPYTPNRSPYQVEVGPETGQLLLQLVPEAVVFGTIRGDDGKPLEQVSIDVLVSQIVAGKREFRPVRQNVVPDADGSFLIGDLAPGRYYLRVNASQASREIVGTDSNSAEKTYPAEVYYPLADAAGAGPLDLFGGQRRQANFTLKKTASIQQESSAQQEPSAQLVSAGGTRFEISGVLVDATTGQPIRQARVAIAPATRQNALTAIITREDGRFVFLGLAADKYILEAQASGYLFDYFNQHEGFTTGIAIGPGLDSEKLTFRLLQEGAIAGRISDEAGEPVRDAQVLLFHTGVMFGEGIPRLFQRGTTNEAGLYHFSHLLPGKYLIAVVSGVWYAQRPAPQQQPATAFYSGVAHSMQTIGTYPEEQGWSPLDVAYPIAFFPGTTEVNAASQIVIKSGDRFVADVTLQPVPALHVHVATRQAGDADGATPGTVQLQTRLFDVLPVDVAAETRMLNSGEIDITGLSPGHYWVGIHGRQGGAVMKSGEIVALSSGESILERQASSVPVTARIEFERGTSPQPPEHLQLFDSKLGQYYSQQVVSAGEIEFNPPVQPGSYTLTMSGNNADFIKTVSASGATVIGQTVDIEGTSPVSLNVIVARGPGVVNGVALREGKPLAGAMIVLVPSDPVHNQSLFRRDQSDSDGTFTLASVKPGKYTLLAIANGWDLEWMNPAVIKPYLLAGEALEIQENGKYDVKVRVQ
jgi:hypothetical protein